MVLRWPICHHKYEYFTPFIVASIFLNLFLYNTLESLLHSFSWNWENISSNQKENINTAHYSVSGVSFSALLCPHQWNFERLQPLLVGIQPIQTKTTLYQCWGVGKALSYYRLKIDLLLISICNDLKFALSFE